MAGQMICLIQAEDTGHILEEKCSKRVSQVIKLQYGVRVPWVIEERNKKKLKLRMHAC